MPSFGEELRRERELRRITLREVAESTKITLRYLEALEKNDFAQLPGGVFNRGFVRAYAEFIGVDPESMVTAYLLEEQTRGSADPGSTGASSEDSLLRGAHSSGLPSPPGEPSSGMPAWSKWLLALIAIAALAVGGVYLARWLSGDDVPVDTGAVPTTLRDSSPRSASNAPGDEPAPAVEPGAPRTTEAADAAGEVADDAGGETASEAVVSAVIHVDRPTTGRVNCDNRQIETLDGAQSGTTLELDCARFLIIDVVDAGALRLALAGGAAAPLGTSGTPLEAYRVDLTTRAPAEGLPQ